MESVAALAGIAYLLYGIVCIFKPQTTRARGALHALFALAILIAAGQVYGPTEAERAAAAEERRKAEAAESARIAAEETACRNSSACFGDRYLAEARVYCQFLVEDRAKYAYEWIDRLGELRFSNPQWIDKEAGILGYSGNYVRFQNGFGAWQRMNYICAFHPETETAISVDVF